ncbi:hypothetical protein Tco_0417906 [Tanacetum coccineum]
MTNATINQLIAQGVADALAEIEANRTSRNGEDSYDSGIGSRRTERVARECTYTDFLKCQHLNFKGTKGVAKGTDVVSYTQRFQELALMFGRMFPEESDEVEKYVSGLPDMIQGSVMASKPKTMQDAIEIANELMDQKVRAYAERQAKNKRKLNNNNQAQQQLPKRPNMAQAYAVGTGERKEYTGTLLLCNKCKFHHNGPCTARKSAI